MYAVPPDFLNTVVPKYPALQQRIQLAFGAHLDAKVQYANAAILANVARDVFLDISHRRLFVKAFVSELARQHALGEHVLAEEEAVAIVRGQVDDLSGGETPPY
jgi:hypothetical protein